MSDSQIACGVHQYTPAVQPRLADACWYALQTRCRFEKKVEAQLQSQGIETFLPTVKQIHHWSDRRQKIEVPLFPGYAFVRTSSLSDCRQTMIRTRGVMGFVSMRGNPLGIPDKQINDVRLLITNEIACKEYSFLKPGQRVRIRGGCLDGIEGTLLSENKNRSLVVGIEAIQRSVALRIEGYDLEAI